MPLCTQREIACDIHAADPSAGEETPRITGDDIILQKERHIPSHVKLTDGLRRCVPDDNKFRSAIAAEKFVTNPERSFEVCFC